MATMNYVLNDVVEDLKVK